MKIRIGFVSNSSSSSFLITNLTDKEKTLMDFLNEVLFLVDEYNDKYTFCPNPVTKEQFLNKEELDEFGFYPEKWKPNEQLHASFGDEDGTIVGKVLDYMLRDGGKTESFKWFMTECRGVEY